MLNETAVKIAVKIIAKFEGCHLRAYPDPASKLSKALSANGMLTTYMSGKLRYEHLPANFKALSGIPWTCGYGETKGVTKDTAYTREEATERLNFRVREFMTQAIKDCPALANKSPEKIAAITSLCYNIGNPEFKTSTACRKIKAGEDFAVPAAIKLFNKAQGQVNNGLINRRQMEADLWVSV